MTTPKVSFEFFPPKTLDASFRLWETAQVLAPLKPEFTSVTYGAGGTTRKLTHEAVGTIHKNYGLNVAAHLTCVEATKAETMDIVDAYAEVGVTEIVALRGDPPQGAKHFTPHPEGFASSVELIEALAEDGRFTIRAGAYPEPHPDAADNMADVRWLKRKVEAGATSAITQFFFEPETFFRFRDACEREGIDAKIIPGILPIQSWKGAKKFAQSCGTSIPAWVEEAFEAAIRDGREHLLATALCTELCDKLIEGGVEDLHFYTLNRPGLTRDVCHALGVTPDTVLEKVA
ncbi:MULTISPECIES: methylenetetrahydrofolate reductase [NAD(P)H] [unclassified Thioclava]|uniref:methylenetetrahydrofolate reductase [NAD(P)H] n=1 Tax=unclassified Thioclava TaxID=2621713 RepID=UPI000B540E2D|nr:MULTISPECIES: methylenetetrahydrofolate reductase [NAD(P)H] [unclassified Thioclava]OWY03341.1 methylenetetrahydrofolate reductase [NAD(P)H] [Thioclava sp. IC9]OWY14379.1 methylenetetrahydrofolate reductase [NAD(P)H] [Thioclava sp. F34-6]OWY16023.1 methylenetetrahydrofolate reductase [NAD(P)H] [Thioclava sp. JM3]